MDAGADDTATLHDVLQCRDDELPGRSEDDRGVERLLRAGGTCPRGSHVARETLCVEIGGSREREHFPPFRPRELRENLRRRAEAVEADASRVADHPVGAKSNETRAQKR